MMSEHGARGYSAMDRLLMQRACELAERGRGNTAPNPSVGAVIARNGRVLGEGYHHRRGGPHAEVEAFRAAAAAGESTVGATIYVTLEPCNHHGLTPPCTQAVLDGGIARAVIGTLDPNPKTAEGGVRALRERGVSVEVVEEPRARALIEDFAVVIDGARPFLTLKMAASLDGYVAPEPGKHWLTGAPAVAFVRELRATHDAVMVGAGTVRVDDPLLTLRPPRARVRPYRRVVACETAPVSAEHRIFAILDPASEGAYAPTIVLAPAGLRAVFAPLERVAEMVYVGDERAERLDLRAALAALREHDVSSVLCEGGPTLAAGLLRDGLVDRLHWLVAPRFLANERAVPALARLPEPPRVGLGGFDPVVHLGEDLWISARLSY